MNLLELFKTYLQNKDNPASKFTIKNYLADLRKFIGWYEAKYQRGFEAANVTLQIIEEFKKEKSQGGKARSTDRYLSTLRLFFNFAKLESLISSSPFEEQKTNDQRLTSDPYRLKDFKSFLYIYNASHLTIKNYLIDVKQFLKWAEEVTGVKDAWNVNDKNLFNWLDSGVVEEYKQRLVESDFSPLSINRKLSSLRRYLGWAQSEGLVSGISNKVSSIQAQKNAELESRNYAESLFRGVPRIVPQGSAIESLEQNDAPKTTREYSNIPPLRLAQKTCLAARLVTKGINLAFDRTLIHPLANIVGAVQYRLWKLRGKPVFTHRTTQTGTQKNTEFRVDPFSSPRASVSNIKKVSYAPLTISTRYLPFHLKLWHHARHTRPDWYRQYHENPIVHYFHFAILVIFMSALGFGLYQNFVAEPKEKSGVLAATVSPLKILSFQGRLTDASDNPITSSKLMRFTVYNDLSASGAARLWEEVERVSPDTDGIFSILLGSDGAGGNAALCNGGDPPASPATGACGIPQSLFAQNAALYLGVTVQDEAELTPRQQLATVAYATNAEVLQGMPPITDAGVTTNTNAVLALNSSGQVAISGTAVTTFQSTGGQMTLVGKTLALNTASGTGTNIQIVPDGFGTVDIQKPIQNTSNNNNIGTAVGSVEVDDLLSVLATSSGQSAFTINQTGAGPLISASASGVAKFTVDNSGNGYFAGDVGIGITSPNAKLAINGNALIGYAEGTAGGPSNGLAVSGFLGVGTTSPGFSLEVLGSAGTAVFRNTSSTSYGGVRVYNDQNSSARALEIDYSGSAYATSLLTNGATGEAAAITTTGSYPLMLGTANTFRILIDSAGKVGIGNATPLATLDVTGSASVSANMNLAGAGTAHTFNILDNGTLNFVRSPGGDAGATMANSMLFLNSNGNVGIGTTDPTSLLSVGSTSQFQVNSSGAIAAATGITSSGTITFSGFNANNNVMYATVTTGVLAGASTNTESQCLLSGATAPTWGTCSSSSSSPYWNQSSSGLLFPNNSTVDFAIGGQSTASAKFAFININSGNPTASISGNLALAVPTGNAPASTINLLNNGTLNILRSPGGDAGATMANSMLFLNNNGNVGIGTTAPVGKLQVEGTNVGKALAIFNETGTNDIIAASTSGATKFRVNSSGSVIASMFYDIDNTSYYVDPAAAGTALNMIGSASTSANLTFQGASTAHAVNILDNGTLDFRRSPGGDAGATAANSILFLNNNGNVGIGTTDPTQKLEVNGSVLASTSLILGNGTHTIAPSETWDMKLSTGGNMINMIDSNNDDTTSVFGIQANGTATNIAYIDQSGNASLSGTLTTSTIKPPTGAFNLQYKSGANAWSNALTVLDNSGNVGIGTATPVNKLEIKSTSGSNILQLTNNSIGDGTNNALVISDGTNEHGRLETIATQTSQQGADGVGLHLKSSVGDRDLGFTTAAARSMRWYVGTTQKMTLNGSGYLGVNNTTPLTALDVTGSASLSANLSLRGAGTTHTLNVLDGGRLDFQTSVGGDAGVAAKMTILNNGNVGIGTTNPSGSFLEVSGAGFSNNTTTYSKAGTLVLSGTGNRTAGLGGQLGFAAADSTSDPAVTYFAASINGFAENSTDSNAAGALAFHTTYWNGSAWVNTEKVRITSDGNVGIGDTSPDYLLELYDATNTPTFALSDDDIGHGVTTLAQTDTFFHLSSISTTVGGAQLTGLASATGIALGLKGVQSSDPTDTTPAISLIGTKANGTGVQDLADAETVLQIANNDNTAALTVLGNGAVGIGTVSPSEKLEIAGNIELSGLINSNNSYAYLASNYGLGLRNLANGTAANSQEILLDESATNLVNNPRPATSGTTNWACWVDAETCSTTNITDSTMPGVGDHAIQVANTGISSHTLSARTNTDYFSITSGQSYTVSFYAKSSTNRTVSVWLQRSTTPWDAITNSVDVSLTTGWQKFVVTLVATATDNAQLNWDSTVEASGTFAIANVLTENRAYATSYFDGAMGAGYSWTGTAHNSTSTRSTGTYFGTLASKNVFINSTGLSTDGSIGIGTTSPGYKLTVNDNSTTYATDVLQNNADGWGSYIWVNNADTDKDAFHIDNSAGAIFAVKNGGNVGVGTTAPRATLDITGSASLSANMNLAGASTAHTFNILDNGTLNFIRSPGGDAGATMANSVLFLNNNGNVGIGTTAPGAKLEVAGEILGQFAAGSNLIAYDNGASTTTATTYTKVKEMQLGWGGGLTVKFNLDGSCTGFNCEGTAYGRLYKNGSAVGTERTAAITQNDGSCDYSTYSENLTGLAAGDLIQVYGKVVNTSGTNSSCLDNFQLYANYAPVAKATTPTPTDTADIAENYITPKEEFIGAGDIVSIDASSSGKTPILSKSKTPYDSKMAGVVSTNPAMTLDEKTGENGGVPIALVGRVPVKVVFEGGKIKAGDTVTSSSVPGVGMRAEQAGPIIGKALEAWDGSNESKIVEYYNKDTNSFIYDLFGLPADYSPSAYPNILPIAKIMVFADLGWYDPGPVLADTGDLQIVSSIGGQLADISQTETNSGILNTKYLILNTAGQLVQRVGAFAEIAVANLRAGLIQASEISTDSLKIATDNISIGGVGLKDYIAEVVKRLNLEQGSTLISPIAEVDQIHTNVISPLSSDSVIVNGKLVLKSPAVIASEAKQSQEIATGSANPRDDIALEVQGSASISGNLSANNLAMKQFSNEGDATISGTLRAKNIIADSIEGLDERLASSKLASSSANPNYTLDASQLGAIDIASFSAQLARLDELAARLAYVQNLTTDTQTITQGLMVFGPTSLSDISVTGQLSVAGNMILSDGAINVLGSSLELQPLKQGAISMMGGMVAIDTEGNLTALGNVTIKGVLAANIISPIPDADLVIQLGGTQNNAEPNTKQRGNFIIKDSSGSAVLKINQLGDVIASGAGSFAKLNLNPISQAIALSDHEVIATGSAGVATISAHLTELTVRNNAVTDKSLIYITPVGDTNNQVLYLLRQVPGISFTVGISQPLLKEIPFNWMLVN